MVKFIAAFNSSWRQKYIPYILSITTLCEIVKAQHNIYISFGNSASRYSQTLLTLVVFTFQIIISWHIRVWGFCITEFDGVDGWGMLLGSILRGIESTGATYWCCIGNLVALLIASCIKNKTAFFPTE